MVKAEAGDFLGRFREIVSDPLNLLIKREADAGMVKDGLVSLHNGHKVALAGDLAYYGRFSEILAINRGVHEPLEEYIFQILLRVIGDAPVMLELGAYWAHYSMWIKQARPKATTVMVEPDRANIAVGRLNFERNGYEGEFLQAFVGQGHWSVDAFLKLSHWDHLDVLHADVQGYELEMINGGEDTLRAHAIDYLFVSTHSQALHEAVETELRRHGYRIEVSSDVDHATTSFDGLVFASSPRIAPLFADFALVGRLDILRATEGDLVTAINQRLAIDQR